MGMSALYLPKWESGVEDREGGVHYTKVDLIRRLGFPLFVSQGFNRIQPRCLARGIETEEDAHCH